MRNPVARLFILLALLCSCQTATKQKDSCEGEFDFSAINTLEEKVDAYNTIAQFAELDSAVDIVQSDKSRLKLSISAFGDKCDAFANSFLQSDIVSLQGLKYLEMP